MELLEKKKIVENLQERFSKSAIVIITDYKGLDVATISMNCGASSKKKILSIK